MIKLYFPCIYYLHTNLCKGHTLHKLSHHHQLVTTIYFYHQ
nr:MAG TPA: Prp18 domain [Caudoviricetes sp.]